VALRPSGVVKLRPTPPQHRTVPSGHRIRTVPPGSRSDSKPLELAPDDAAERMTSWAGHGIGSPAAVEPTAAAALEFVLRGYRLSARTVDWTLRIGRGNEP